MYKVKRFSKDKSDKKKGLNKGQKVGIGLAAGGLGVNTAAGLTLQRKEGDLFKIKDNEKLLEKVKDNISKEGLSLKKAYLLTGEKNAFYDAANKQIVDAGLGHNADFLAHELGHHKVQTSKNPLVRMTQGKVGNISRLATGTGVGTLGGIAAGAAAGKKAARDEFEGKKEGKLTKYGHHAVAVGSTLPMIASEALASGHALKILKKSGASKKDLLKAAGNLGVAGATYGSLAAMNAGQLS